MASAFKVKNAESGLVLSKMFFRRVDQRRQLCLFHGKQLNDLLPRQFILLFAQFSTEVLDVHLRNIHALVHGDLPPPESLILHIRKSKDLAGEKKRFCICDDASSILRHRPLPADQECSFFQSLELRWYDNKAFSVLPTGKQRGGK